MEGFSEVFFCSDCGSELVMSVFSFGWCNNCKVNVDILKEVV